MKQIINLHENPGKIKNSKSIFNNIKIINIDYSQENFLVFFLNTTLTLINAEVLFKGGLDSCLVDPKTIFRKALINNSSSIIVAHNHPSGDLTPSQEEDEVFNNLKGIGKLIGIDVIDSIIFNQTEYYSPIEV